ncbi:hypothetical protein CROQUDRAFT_701277 [Cronartium quercuum f. sp. fusiforme G11]|uniref:Uncharacterized protein n=1 Tax=Cronartium quercuum f. sp. fusiforme G11 TaxID=708437 RepID=A0A9P6NTT3_9BASI|nr:hypothetical protein CROQUDRAFT_701277 [Cronartium quercuum f. sp. fusiforme G11]
MRLIDTINEILTSTGIQLVYKLIIFTKKIEESLSWESNTRAEYKFITIYLAQDPPIEAVERFHVALAKICMRLGPVMRNNQEAHLVECLEVCKNKIVAYVKSLEPGIHLRLWHKIAWNVVYRGPEKDCPVLVGNSAAAMIQLKNMISHIAQDKEDSYPIGWDLLTVLENLCEKNLSMELLQYTQALLTHLKQPKKLDSYNEFLAFKILACLQMFTQKICDKIQESEFEVPLAEPFWKCSLKPRVLEHFLAVQQILGGNGIILAGSYSTTHMKTLFLHWAKYIELYQAFKKHKPQQQFVESLVLYNYMINWSSPQIVQDLLKEFQMIQSTSTMQALNK